MIITFVLRGYLVTLKIETNINISNIFFSYKTFVCGFYIYVQTISVLNTNKSMGKNIGTNISMPRKNEYTLFKLLK